MLLPEGTELRILAPVAVNRKGEQRELIEDLLKQGFTRARVDGQMVRLTSDLNLDRRRRHNIEVHIERVIVSEDSRTLVADAVERALKLGGGNLLAMLGTEDAEDAAAMSLEAAGSDSVFASASRNSQFDLDDDDEDFDEEEEFGGDSEGQVDTLPDTARPKAGSLPDSLSGSDADAESLPEELAEQQLRGRGATWPSGWTNGQRLFSVTYSCLRCGVGYPLPSPQLFSFNSPQGMCLTCKGMGWLHTFDPELVVVYPEISFEEGCIELLGPFSKLSRWQQHIFQGFSDTIEAERGLSPGYLMKSPWSELPADLRRMWMFGTGDKEITFAWRGGAKDMNYQGTFAGVVAELHNRYAAAKTATSKSQFERYMSNIECPDCVGQRLNAQARCVTLAADVPQHSDWQQGLSLPTLCSMAIQDALAFFEHLQLTDIQRKIASDALKEVHNRLRFLMEVGLSYLSLDRTAPTLSGGESQRIRLAGQIGASLVGVLYILYEPSIGLHPRDNDRLIQALCRLRDLGNTVVVVEHDEDTMLASDRIVDFGPGPGNRGGYLVAEGAP